MVSLKGCKLLEDDKSVLRHWGDCMKRAKVGDLGLREIKSNSCMWCQKYNNLITKEIGKPGDPCTLDCPIRFYTGKSGCVGSPWHDVADELKRKELINLGLTKLTWVADDSSMEPCIAQIYQETKRMFLFIVEVIRFKRMTPEERTRVLNSARKAKKH